MEIVRESYSLASILPKHERYGLSAQISKSSVSIPSNIAEGSSRSSDKDYKRFLEIALGSCFELETQIIVGEMVFPNLEFNYDSVLI